MDFKSTIDLIIRDLNEASEIIDDLKKYPGVPLLQVELAKSKCKSAGEVIALLKTITDIIPVKDEPLREKKDFQSQVETSNQERPPRPNQSPGEKKNEANLDLAPSPSPDKKTEAKGPVKKIVEPTIVADKFSRISDRYDEQIRKIKAEKDLSDRLKTKPISSLSDAIGISDKFLFIGEIFEGNKEAYAQAISRLDKVESLDDAVTIIKGYTGEKPESEAVVQLLDLVRLKLPSNE